MTPEQFARFDSTIGDIELGRSWAHLPCECGATYGELHDCELDLVTVDGEEMHPTEEP